MLATTADDGDPKAKDELLRTSDRLAAVVAFCPPTDIRPWFKTNKWKEYLAFRFNPADAGAFSPLLFVTAKMPPTLLVHGDKDTAVPIEHSQKILAEMQKNHVPCELMVIKGGTTAGLAATGGPAPRASPGSRSTCCRSGNKWPELTLIVHRSGGETAD